MLRYAIHRLGLLVLMSSVVVMLAACSSGGSGSPLDSKSEASNGSTGSVSSTSAAAAIAPALDDGSTDALAGGTTSNQAAGTAAAASNWDRMIIRDASITLQVTNVESMLATVRTITDSASGVVFASSTSFDGDNQIATMTLDIPAAQFDQVVTALRAAAGVKKVQSESITSQDVTDQYVDYQSQLKSLNATQDRLLALMNSATNINDIITINDRLTNVQTQIDQITGRINYIDQKTTFSRITLTINPVALVVHQNSSSGFDLRQAVSSAWDASLRFTGGGLTLLVKVIVFCWWLVPLAAIVALLIARRRQRRHSALLPTE